MPDKINNISSQALKKATGKGWDEWIRLLDKEGAAKMTHKEIARFIAAVLRAERIHYFLL